MPRFHALCLVLLSAAALPAAAQSGVQVENVRTEYARVLRAEPVYQTLRTTAMVEDCGDGKDAGDEGEARHGLARVVGAVKDALTPNSDRRKDEAGDGDAPAEGCRMVPTEKEFRRPIAYDVDYVHHGVKYRSRLPYDPGERVRVRVSITPIVPSGAGKP